MPLGHLRPLAKFALPRDRRQQVLDSPTEKRGIVRDAPECEEHGMGSKDIIEPSPMQPAKILRPPRHARRRSILSTRRQHLQDTERMPLSAILGDDPLGIEFSGECGEPYRGFPFGFVSARSSLIRSRPSCSLALGTSRPSTAS